MILVLDGTLLLTLPAVGDNKIFERLHLGSSLAVYSLLRAEKLDQGRIFFKVTSLRASTILLINKDLLTKVRKRYPVLD